MYKVSKPSGPSRTSSCEDQIIQHLDGVMSMGHALPKPKVLKSCIRCRKHKTKCDAHDRLPNACSTCAKKGVACKIDYVLPPQRTDNLKTILTQVAQIRDDYERLELTYGGIFASLGIHVPSFEDWKQSKTALDETIYEEEEDESICLLKLTDESFISLNLLNTQQLLINNTIIDISAFEIKLESLVKKLKFMYSTLAPESCSKLFTTPLNYESDSAQSQNSSSSESSVASPRSITHQRSPVITSSTMALDSLQWFDLDFHVTELFRVNKFLLILLVAHFYPSETISPSYTVFLPDYLNSFYQIIESQNKSLTSSTYSNHLLNTIIPGHSIFDKHQLLTLVDSEVFNSDVYLKRITQILFINVLLFGVDENLSIMNDFVQFVELSINLNRKKINFDKSTDLRFIECVIRLLNVFTGASHDPQLHMVATKRKSVRKEFETLFSLLKMDSSIVTQGVSADGDITNVGTLKKQFKKFLETWEAYVDMYDSLETIFMDDFVLELVLMNCLVLINEGYNEFNTALVDFLSKHNLTAENENVAQLINAFKAEPMDVQDVALSCEKMRQIAACIASKRRNVLDLKMNDIQVILENVDWKQETTDDVLKKIGVI